MAGNPKISKWSSPSQADRDAKKFGTTLTDEAFALLDALVKRDAKPKSETVLRALRALWGADPDHDTGLRTTRSAPRRK